ncbi:hypothetical protein [Pleionea sp. CnH1-48]|uniref:hypothetical protein n=1 Tax=Pleionea sp. CnH1-48 TaxID=2954494 RepID=UPI002097FBEC|nr:hypothetical protein [Pleionea sp. CnH1-48]MCO7227504.1 hypothetical protein [Pleionea sp. CnH1-48]
MKTFEDILGYEYDWLATDRLGYVALFSTAGLGYAPLPFLEDTDLYDDTIEAILCLSVSTASKVYPKIDIEHDNTWKRVSERGLYSFDADVNTGIYHVASIPQEPLLLHELPKNIASVIERVKLESVLFNEASIISELDIKSKYSAQ